MAASIGAGLLLKGLIAAVFPIGGGARLSPITKQLFARRTWERLRPFSGLLIILIIAAPWHVLATIRNPPYFYFSMRSVPGQYHGFFWFYFINEHLLRFLNLRYPRDYNTVPRLYFWLFHLLWLFPWSFFLPGAVALELQAGRSRRPHAPPGGLLDRISSDLLHLFLDARILLNAVLSGASPAGRLGHGQANLDSSG